MDNMPLTPVTGNPAAMTLRHLRLIIHGDLVIGFGLSEKDALQSADRYLRASEPDWTEKDRAHYVAAVKNLWLATITFHSLVDLRRVAGLFLLGDDQAEELASLWRS